MPISSKLITVFSSYTLSFHHSLLFSSSGLILKGCDLVRFAWLEIRHWFYFVSVITVNTKMIRIHRFYLDSPALRMFIKWCGFDEHAQYFNVNETAKCMTECMVAIKKLKPVMGRPPKETTGLEFVSVRK